MGILDWLKVRGRDEQDAQSSEAAKVNRAVADLPNGYTIERDRSIQRLKLDVPSDEPHEELLRPSLSDLPGLTGMVSAATMVQKAKQFDDGLYAAAELAAMNGCGNATGKRTWLTELRAAVANESLAVLMNAAAHLVDDAGHGSPALEPIVDALVNAFLADEFRSRPMSFYTWTEELTALFRHDRLLQAVLKDEQVAALHRALAANTEVQDVYNGYLRLISRLTNPLVEKPAVFPASVAIETDLIKRLYGNSPIPDGFDLMTELLKRIRAREIDLTPKEQSGWYDHQIWSLEPFALPDGAAEAQRMALTAEYKSHLEDLFKGVMALAREAHAKQLEMAVAGLAAPMDPGPRKPSLTIRPDLSTEPVLTHYRRRADSYRFVRQVLEDYFGRDGLRQMHRQTANGPIEVNLDDELSYVTALFDGAAQTASFELGIGEAERSGVLADWNYADDPDMRADIRMMVPVFFDRQRQQTKVWAVLGWSTRPLHVSFYGTPGIRVLDDRGRDATADFDISYDSRRYNIAYPVFEEVYVGRILNRAEFRKLCDSHRSREAIVAAL